MKMLSLDLLLLLFGFFYRFYRGRNREEVSLRRRRRSRIIILCCNLFSFELLIIFLFCTLHLTFPLRNEIFFLSKGSFSSHQYPVLMMMMMEKKKEFKNLMIIYQVEIIKKAIFHFLLPFYSSSCRVMRLKWP